MRNRGSRTRGSGLNRGLVWGAGIALAAVATLTAYSALTGNDDHNNPSASQSESASPASPGTFSPGTSTPQAAPSYTAPGSWTEPLRWLALPRGTKNGADGTQTGWPDTTDGAVALLVAASTTNMQGSHGMVDQQMAIYNNYLAAADQSPANAEKIKASAAKTDANSRSDLGLPASGPLPSGAFVRANVVGFRIIESSPSEVTAYLLTKVSQKAGETAPLKDSYVVSVLGASWQDTDWKLSTKASAHAVAQTQGQQQPAIASPGDVAFNDAGWTAIRQAS
ncbi:hypothetical protein [Kitasatospora sp. NPDC002965]|uniref:hypothetical protein n=1 Tax=Kitasatospora sp. NPDC002965 TaxID=3154775 RepID=UPI0033AF63CC